MAPGEGAGGGLDEGGIGVLGTNPGALTAWAGRAGVGTGESGGLQNL